MRPEGGVCRWSKTDKQRGRNLVRYHIYFTVAAALYRCDVINGSKGSCDDAVPASFIKTGSHRAIGIALRPQHFIRAVLGKKRCHGHRLWATRRALPTIVVPAEPAGCCRTHVNHL